MSLLQSTTDIFGEIHSSWNLTDIAWPNVRYDPQDNGGLPYIQVNIVETTGSLIGMSGNDSSNAVRSEGDLVGSLFLPADLNPQELPSPLTGKDGVEIASAFKQMLSNKVFNSTILFTGRVVDAGLSDDRAWYRYNIIIPYQSSVLEDK